MTLPQYLHLYSYHLCAQDLTLTLKSVIQLGRLCSLANARMKRMNSLDVSRQNKILNILKARKMILTANAPQNTLKQTQQQHHFWL